MSNRVQIIQGDAREEIGQLEIVPDVVITDPVWPNCPAGLLPGWDQPKQLLAETLAVVPDSVKRLVIILRSDSDPRFLEAVPKRWVFFNAHWLQYVLPGYIGRKLGGNEIAYAFGEPVIRRPGRRVIPSVAPKAQPSDRPPNGHPCSRTMPHMDWLVKWWSDEGETILDPFAGSGTIGLAAIRQNRRAILIESEAEYVDLARRRINEFDPLFNHERSSL